MIGELEAIKYKNTNAKKTIVYRPKDIYLKINGIAPDLLVFFGDLYWRSIGSVGFNDVYTFNNDTGPDDANHDYHGIFIMYDKKIKKPRHLAGISIYDFAPTLLFNMGMKESKDMKGRILC